MGSSIYSQVREKVRKGENVSIVTELDGEEGSVEKDMKRTLSDQLPGRGNGAERQVKPSIEEKDGKIVVSEPVLPRERLIVLGGGHISVFVVEFAARCGFDVYVCDDRPSFASEKRFPEAAGVICDSFENALEKLHVTPYDYVVTVTRGHTHDADCLRALFKGSFPAYLGLIGSRRRVRGLFDMLEKEGFPRELMDKIQTPIGFSIGAVTPEEIAVSITAELIAFKRQPERNTNENRYVNASDLDPEMIDYLAENHDSKAVVTIIETKGSTPREEGAKMAVDPRGRITGTIGGGCSEGGIIREAVDIIGTGRYKVIFIDLRGEVAESDGMVCGGIMKVLVEDGTEK